MSIQRQTRAEKGQKGEKKNRIRSWMRSYMMSSVRRASDNNPVLLPWMPSRDRDTGRDPEFVTGVYFQELFIPSRVQQIHSYGVLCTRILNTPIQKSELYSIQDTGYSVYYSYSVDNMKHPV